MEVQFLGTSSGVPTKKRNVTGIAVKESKGNRWYLVDCGEATQHQLLHTNLSLNSLSGIFITHIHGDHCYGLPGLLASAGMSGRKEPLTIIAPEGVKKWFLSTQEFTELFLPYEVNFISVENNLEQKFGQFSIRLRELSHRVPSFAYIFTETQTDANLSVEKLESLGVPRGPLWGKIKSEGQIEFQGEILKIEDFLEQSVTPRKIIVCGDNDNPQLLAEDSQGCDLLIHESTYTKDMAEKAANVGHSYAAQVAAFASENKIPNLLLTHFSPRYQSDAKNAQSIEDIREEAAGEYTGRLFLAQDFDQYNLDKSGCVSLKL